MRILLALGALLWPFFALAHEGEEQIPEAVHFLARYDFLNVAYTASLVVAILALAALIRPPQKDFGKFFFFILISAVILSATFYLSAGTIYENMTSVTGGPVHWHADFRIFKCGEELNFQEPSGFSNRIGTPEIHEHADGRIHIEGTLKDFKEASLHGFIEATGGRLTLQEMAFPANEGMEIMKSGDSCSDGSEGRLQVFLWTLENNEARQQKLFNFTEYVISSEAIVPPGDCVIFEFGPQKDKTDYICGQYEVAELRGDIKVIR